MSRSPADLAPASVWSIQAERILRSRGEGETSLRIFTLLGHAVLFGMCYGAVMGAFGGFASDRLLQIFYSAVKVPLLVVGSFVLSVPSFYVFNAMFGLSRDFPAALRGLSAAQSGMTIILASFAPFTALWYLSFTNYNSALAWNGLMFACASLAAQVLLRRHYAPLIARDGRHKIMLICWAAVYMLVAIQLAWLTRPFIGDPARPPEFFRADAFDRNAYEVVVRTAKKFLWGG